MPLRRLVKLMTGRGTAPTGESAPGVEAVLDGVGEPYRSRLLSMYRAEPQRGEGGDLHAIDACTKTEASQGKWLHDLCVEVKPAASLEIGMAYGYSTLFFLAAITKNGAGHHTAIDPFQRTQWRGIGLRHVADLDQSRVFSHIDDRSDRAATDLARAGASFQVIYIDGSHKFDDVLVDFYLYAQLCAVGGYIVLDDRWMPSIQTAAAFIRANRVDFTEVSTSQRNAFVFRRVGEDTREWDEFRPFDVAGRAPQR